MATTEPLKAYDKIPVIDFMKCTKCDACIHECPVHAIIKTQNPACEKCIKYCLTMQVPCYQNNYFFNYQDCILCGLCMEICPVDAIYWLTRETVHRTDY